MKLLSRGEVEKILKNTAPVAGKKMLEPFKSWFRKELPFGIMEDFEFEKSDAEVHKLEGDLWLCLEGEVEFICGGELVESWVKDAKGNELGGKGIRGGSKTLLKPGDWLWIPSGEPHLHTAKFGRMAIIKILKH